MRVSPEIRRAAEVLRAGGLVAFPTETVYGLGADAGSAAAVARLYAAKGRPADHPVIVHFADAASALAWARGVPDGARRLAARFWPGPLTMILKRSALAGDYVTGGQDSVGLRVPSHPVAQALLREFGGGIAAPSANRFGEVSATTAEHVRADLAAEIDLVLDGGASEVGIESTIVDLSGARPALLRPGRISAAQVAEILGEVVAGADDESPRRPGGLERHYAPRTPARLASRHAIDTELAAQGRTLAVLSFSGPDARAAAWLRMPKEPQACAQRLYAALRELDAAGCSLVLIEAPPDGEEWAAVRDRLERATA